MQGILETLEVTKDVKPITIVNGVPVYTFAEAQALNIRDLKLEKADGKPVDLGERAFTEDGAGYRRSKVKRAAVDPTVAYENRYRVLMETIEPKEEGEKPKEVVKGYEVVIDYRAIKEQASGQVYTNNIMSYTVAKKGKSTAVLSVNTITPDEFINDFKKKLNVDVMLKVQGAIAKLGGVSADGDAVDL